MKTVKRIKIDVSKCTGCKACEVACSAFHAKPRYSSVNPERARIRVFRDEFSHTYLPVLAGEYTEAECNGKLAYTIDGKEYSSCSFCRASCPSRGSFKEPDSGLPLKCDMCEELPPGSKPMCVQWCPGGALTYEQGEEEGEEEAKPEQMELGLDELVKKFGKKKVMDTLVRISKG